MIDTLRGILIGVALLVVLTLVLTINAKFSANEIFVVFAGIALVGVSVAGIIVAIVYATKRWQQG